MTNDQIREVVFQAAGAASVPFMQDHPNYTMPTERITERVEEVLAEFGLAKVETP